MTRRNANLPEQAEGYDAALAGADLSSNPYPAGPGEWRHSDWAHGFAGVALDKADAEAAERLAAEQAAEDGETS